MGSSNKQKVAAKQVETLWNEGESSRRWVKAISNRNGATQRREAGKTAKKLGKKQDLCNRKGEELTTEIMSARTAVCIFTVIACKHRENNMFSLGKRGKCSLLPNKA